MIKIYYDPDSNGFYQTDFHKVIPDGAIEILAKTRWEIIEGQSKGKTVHIDGDKVILRDFVKNNEILQQEERMWRDSELINSDQQLNKVQDADPKSFGSVAVWRAYRKALRAWPEHEKFPDSVFRPKSPKREE